MPDDDAGFFRNLSGLATEYVRHKRRSLTAGDPETNVDATGGGHRYSFGGQEITFEDLRDVKDIRDSGGQIATLLHSKALLNFGEGAEVHVENDDDTAQLIDGEELTLSEWLETEAFPKLDLLVLDLGEDALSYPCAVGEIQETVTGDFKRALPAEPWTIIPVTNEHGEVEAYRQRTKAPSGGYTEQTLPAEDLWHIVINKASARDQTGISEVLRNKDEIRAFKENEAAINQAIELHGFPQRHVKVGREEGAPVSDNDLRRVRSIFDPRTTDANTAYFTGQDVDVETLEAHQFDYSAIHEMDMRNLTTALGLPLEAGNVGADGLGSGKPAELRFALLKLAIKANQRSFGVQFVERVMRPVIRDYSPFDHNATITLDIADPLEDIGEVAELIGQIGDYMTNEEIRSKLDMPAPEDEEIAEGYRSPADIEAPEDEGGDFGGLFRDGADARTLQQVPDNAVSISDRSEAPDDAQIITGPGGGLYYVPGAGDGDSGGVDPAVAEEVVDNLPDEYDGSDEQRESLGNAAAELVESGATYSEAVDAIESGVGGLDTSAERTVRQQAFVNREATMELDGEEVTASPVLKEGATPGKSDLREVAEGQLSDTYISEQPYGPDQHESQSVYEGWRDERNGSLLNGDTAELWGAAIDRYGNDNVPDNATADPDTVGEPLPVDEDPDADPVTAIGDNIQNTREVLSEVFGESVPVARGVSGEFAEQIKEAKEAGEPVELDHRVLESWSTFPDHSERFADEGDEDGVIITTEVPIDDVYGSSHTTPGMGEEENELIVGNDGPKTYDADQIQIANDEGMVETYDSVARD